MKRTIYLFCFLSFLFVFVGFLFIDLTSAQVLKFKKPDEAKAKKECDAGGKPLPELVSTILDGEPNLALLEDAKPEASSLLAGWCPQRHCIEYLNDGFYNNCRSWISGGEPSWAQIDIGQVAKVNRVFFGSDKSQGFNDRAAAVFEILLADKVADKDSKAATWKRVFKYNDPAKPIRERTEFKFATVDARWVRIDITQGVAGQVRIDEIEIYGGKNPLAVEAADKLATTWGAMKR
jgi:hypothetical protein